MLERLLVAIDGSPSADAALDVAIGLSRRFRSEVLLCTATDSSAAIAAACVPNGTYPSTALILEEYEQAAKSLIAAAASRASVAGIAVTTMLLEGRPAAAVVACAQERGVHAIVVGTRGRSGFEHAFLGSTAEGVLRMSDVPVFVVRDGSASADAGEAAAFGRILVALDESDASLAAQSFALELAASQKSRVLYCNVVETSDLLGKAETFGYDATSIVRENHRAAAALSDARAQAANERGVKADSVIVEGAAASAILEAATAHGANLIAVGTHGRRGLRRLFLGSVAEEVVRRSSLPVLVVRALVADGERRKE